MIINLVDELQATVPIADDVVEDMILNPFIQGDINFEIEVRAAMSDKSETFDLNHLGRFKQVLEAHSKAADVRFEGQHKDIQSIEYVASNLEKKALNRVWARKYRDREASDYHAKLEWANDRQAKARTFGSKWVHSHIELHVAEGTRVDAVCLAYAHGKKSFEKKQGNHAKTALLSSARSSHFMPPTGQNVLSTPGCRNALYKSLLPTWECSQCHKSPILCIVGLRDHSEIVGGMIWLRTD